MAPLILFLVMKPAESQARPATSFMYSTPIQHTPEGYSFYYGCEDAKHGCAEVNENPEPIVKRQTFEKAVLIMTGVLTLLAVLLLLPNITKGLMIGAYGAAVNVALMMITHTNDVPTMNDGDNIRTHNVYLYVVPAIIYLVLTLVLTFRGRDSGRVSIRK